MNRDNRDSQTRFGPWMAPHPHLVRVSASAASGVRVACGWVAIKHGVPISRLYELCMSRARPVGFRASG
jgi:hypothetical protein